MIRWQRGFRPTLDNVGEIRAIHIDGYRHNVFAVTRIIERRTISHWNHQPGLVICECDDLIHDDYIFSNPIDIEEVLRTQKNIARDPSVKIRNGKLFMIKLMGRWHDEYGYVFTATGITRFSGLTEKKESVSFEGFTRKYIEEAYEIKIEDDLK